MPGENDEPPTIMPPKETAIVCSPGAGIADGHKEYLDIMKNTRYNFKQVHEQFSLKYKHCKNVFHRECNQCYGLYRM